MTLPITSCFTVIRAAESGKRFGNSNFHSTIGPQRHNSANALNVSSRFINSHHVTNTQLTCKNYCCCPNSTSGQSNELGSVGREVDVAGFAVVVGVLAIAANTRKGVNYRHHHQNALLLILTRLDKGPLRVASCCGISQPNPDSK